MKRNIGKILAMAIVAIMMMSTIAFADAAMGEPAVADKAVTVTLTGLTANEEATILVVKDGITLETVTDADIVYIDQLTVGEDGSVTFALDASAAVPADATADVYVDIFCGYTNMADADPLAGTAKIFTYVEEEPVEPEPTILYGDVYKDGRVNPRDTATLAQKLVGIEIDMTKYDEAAADVYKDGRINPRDTATLAQKLVGIITQELPIIP